MEPLPGAALSAGILLCLLTISASSLSFHPVSQSLTWDQARRFCRVKHSDLAAVNNAADVNRLVGLLGGGFGHVWIGLRRGGGDRWMWSDGRGGATFSKWREFEPNNDGPCTEMLQTTAWNDLQCDQEREFVCYDRLSSRKHFVHYKEAKTWTSSLEFCREKHTDLAAIESNGENDEVANLIKSWTGYIGLPKEVWIGLFKDDWSWSDGRRTSFRFWLVGVGSGGNCAATSAAQGGRWTRAPCTDQLDFVCQGAPRVKKMVVRMKVHTAVDLSNATVSAELLRKMDTKIRNHRLSDFKLGWQKDKHGFIFHRLEPPVIEEKVTS